MINILQPARCRMVRVKVFVVLKLLACQSFDWTGRLFKKIKKRNKKTKNQSQFLEN
jgi:hypothetical protein